MTSTAYELNQQLRVLFSGPSPSEHPVEKKLASFALLKPKWDFGKGGPTPHAVLQEAKLVLSIGLGLGYDANVFPSSSDAVAVAFYKDGDCIEAIVDGSRALEVFVEAADGQTRRIVDHKEGASLRDLFEMLWDWGQPTEWSLLGSSIPANSTWFIAASPTSHLNLRRETAQAHQMASAGSQ